MQVRQIAAQKQLVMEAPPITGFFYPFLRRLIDELKRLKEEGALFGDEARTPGGVYQVNMDVAAMLNHVRRQMGLDGDASTSYGDAHTFYASEQGVLQLLYDAENFLAVFELTPEEIKAAEVQVAEL